MVIIDRFYCISYTPLLCTHTCSHVQDIIHMCIAQAHTHILYLHCSAHTYVCTYVHTYLFHTVHCCTRMQAYMFSVHVLDMHAFTPPNCPLITSSYCSSVHANLTVCVSENEVLYIFVHTSVLNPGMYIYYRNYYCI